MHTDARLQWMRAWILCNILLFVECSDMATKTACVGECQSRYSLECPLGQKIAIKYLRYSAKPVSSQCPVTDCQNYDQCCKYDPFDCHTDFSDAEAFSVYERCSARQQCGWLHSGVSKGPNCGLRSSSNYVSAEYQCIDDDSFLDICSNLTIQRDTVNLIYNGTAYSWSDFRFRQCACTISTSNCDSPARLHFTTVDVRLHENHNITNCHPHSKFTITDTMGNRDFYCQTNHFYQKYNDIYFSASPYARISLYNHPGLYPSQVWLQVKATMKGVQVILSCGRNAVESPKFCGPPEMLPTTPRPKLVVSTKDIFGDIDKVPSVDPKPRHPPEDTGGGSTSSKEQSDLPAIIGGAVSAAIVILIIILVVCCLRRRQATKKRKQKARESSLVLPPANLPPVPLMDTQEQPCGNYYETVSASNENGVPASENFNMYSPNKLMETFSPTRKTSGQFFPSDMKAPPPPPTPKNEKKPPHNGIESNPYHIPWDSQELSMANRAKRRDLAYATSDEIQVLIQRMEHDRRCLNEGSDEEQVVPDPNFYIHIDNYRIKRPPHYNRHSQMEDGNNADQNYPQKMHGYKYENIEDDDEEEDLLPGASNSVERPKPKPRTLNLDSHDTLNNCESEDTGYRSVGSPDQVLVSEDDYLIPGSAKSSYSGGRTNSVKSSSEASVKDSLHRQESGATVEEDISGSAENNTEEKNKEVRTKF